LWQPAAREAIAEWVYVMSDKPEYLVDQDFLRAHYAKNNSPPRALATYQGPLVEQILVGVEAATSGNPADTVLANVNFVNHMIDQGAYLAGEYPVEALWSYSVDFYMEKVLRDGHWSFLSAIRQVAGNFTVASCASGLKAFGGEKYFLVLATFDDAMKAVAAAVGNAHGKQPVIDKIMEWADIKAREADENFRALNKANSLRPLNGTWLRRLPHLRRVAPERLSSELDALVARNPLRVARLEEHRRDQEQRDAANPMLRSMKELCRLGGLSFSGVTAGLASMTPAAPGKTQHPGMSWGMRTDRGIYLVYFYDRETQLQPFQASLYPQGEVQPLATLALSEADFVAIVPAGLRRRGQGRGQG
jgi:hypothetical protein